MIRRLFANRMRHQPGAALNPPMPQRVAVLMQLIALGDSVNRRQSHTPFHYLLQNFGHRLESQPLVVALGASSAHIKSVHGLLPTREYGYLAFLYVTYNRAARVIQRRVRLRRAAALKIQRAWRPCITNPKHPACRRRLLAEFNALSSQDSICICA
jgi:hypothetical protein